MGFHRHPQHIEVTRNVIQYNGDMAVKGALYIGVKPRDNRETGNRNPDPLATTPTN